MTKSKVESRKSKVAGLRAARWWFLPFIMTFAAFMLGGCDYFGFTPIKEITAAPGQ